MAFTFLHDNLMPGIEKKPQKTFNYHAFKPHLIITSLFPTHLHHALLSLCGKPQGHDVWLSFFISQECVAFVHCKPSHTFVFYKVPCRPVLIYRGLSYSDLLRDADSRGKPPQPLNSQAHSQIVYDHPSPPFLPAPQSRFL